MICIQPILGLAHIFHAGFITPKQKFWCEQAMTAEGLDLPPPWEVQHGNETILQYGNSSDMPEDKKLLGHCVPGCTNYGFDPDFWEATMVTEWDLVCENRLVDISISRISTNIPTDATAGSKLSPRCCSSPASLSAHSARAWCRTGE